MLVLVRGHQRQRAHRLALRTGADDADVAGRVARRLVDVDARACAGMSMKPRSRAIATFCCIDRPTNATLRPCAIAACATCCTRCRCDAKLVTMNRLSGYSRNSDAHRGADRRLRRREARPLGVRRVGQQQAHAAVAARELAEQREVGAAAVDRREVELEVAGVDDRARGREERDREAVRHRVRDRDELAVDRADAAALAVGDRDQLGAVEHARFLDAVARQRERERRAVDRHRRCRGAGTRARRRGPRARA